MIKTRTRFLDENLILPPSRTGLIIKIPRDNPLRRISMNFEIVVTGTAATLLPKEDGLLNYIKNIRLVRNGSDNKIDVDLRTYFYASVMQLGVKPILTTIVTSGVQTAKVYNIPVTFDFAKFKNDLGDLNSLLNAPDLESLNLVFDTGAIGDLFGTVTGGVISTTLTKVNVSIIEVYDDEGKVEELSGLLTNAIDYLEAVETFDITAAHTSFPGSQQTEKIQPVPHIHEISTFLTLDGSGLKKDDVLSILKVANVTSGGETIFIEKIGDLIRRMKSDFALDTAVLGLFSLDWDTLRRGGLRVIEDDAIKWFFQNPAPSGTAKIKLYKKTYAVGV